MTLRVTDLSPHVGAEVASDLATLLGGRSGSAFQDLLHNKGVLLFRNVDVDDAQLLTFAKTIGVVRKERHNPVNKVHLTKAADPIQTGYLRGTFLWHVDSTYEDDPPLGAMLTPRSLPPGNGGGTEFVSTCAAYEGLSDEDKNRIDGLQVVHTMTAFLSKVPGTPSDEFRASWSAFPPRTLPMVRPHRSGRKALILGSSADHVVGMDPAESSALIARLNASMTEPHYIYTHKWRMGDVLIWDNTSTMHRAQPYEADSGRKHSRVQFYADEYRGDASEFSDGKDTMVRMRGGAA